MADEDAPNSEDLGSGKITQQMYAAARRYEILKLLATTHSLTIGEVESNKNLKRQFKPLDRRHVKADFKDIGGLFGRPTMIEATPYQLRSQRLAGQFDKAVGPTSDARDEAKRRVAGHIVRELLSDQAVVYFSGGTSSFETARCLVEEMDHGKDFGIERIVTDSLPIAALFCLYGQRGQRFKEVELKVLGGALNFKNGNITLDEQGAAQLKHWDYTTAVVSVSSIDPRTGAVQSHAQEQTKKKFFSELVVGQLIIPVDSSKFQVKGGEHIYDPQTKKMAADRTPQIVTDELPADASRLQSWYRIHLASGPMQEVRNE